MSRRRRIEIQYDALGHVMTILGRTASEALDNLAAQNPENDGWKSNTITDGTPTGTNDTIVERHALARYETTQYQQQLLDDLDTLTQLAASALTVANKAKAYRAPRQPKEQPTLCRDRQTGRDGTIEWGNPTCTELAVKAGLCSACYQRERRWRIANHLPQRDIEPAA